MSVWNRDWTGRYVCSMGLSLCWVDLVVVGCRNEVIGCMSFAVNDLLGPDRVCVCVCVCLCVCVSLKERVCVCV